MRILRKHLEIAEIITIKQINSGALVEEITTTEDFEGAFFPVSGKEEKLLLEGILKKDSLKLYTYANITDDYDDDIYNKVNYKNKIYKINSKKEFKADNLKLYLLEVLEN